jgi:hypothetical protein
VKIYVVDDVACSINCFRPPSMRGLVFIKHSARHLDEGSVLALHDSILLRRVRSRELMSDTKFIKIVVEAYVLELSAIVTPDVLDLEIIIRHGPSGELPEDILYFILVGNDVHPGVARVVINNDESVERCCIG